MDLVSQSLEKLQPLPSGPEKTRAEITDRLQTLIEYSDRGNREAQFSVGQHYLQEGKLPLAVKMCTCVCVRVCARVCVCACVCVHVYA